MKIWTIFTCLQSAVPDTHLSRRIYFIFLIFHEKTTKTTNQTTIHLTNPGYPTGLPKSSKFSNIIRHTLYNTGSGTFLHKHSSIYPRDRAGRQGFYVSSRENNKTVSLTNWTLTLSLIHTSTKRQNLLTF